MSLASRLLGVVLSLVGGLLMGQGAGVMTMGATTFNIIYTLGGSTPAVGSWLGYYLGGYIEEEVEGGIAQNQFTTSQGSLWAFGVIIAVLGLMLIVRGDRKPRDPREAEPLFPEPMSM